MTIAVWLGSAMPARTVRWLDGALATAAKLGPATAIAAGDAAWLDLAADRAARAGLASAGVATELQLDYLGWAQVAAAIARQLGATTIVVDEASRRDGALEVGAIAELLALAQLTRVVALTRDGEIVHASRIAGAQLMTCRVRGGAVLGVRIAGAPVDDAPTPAPSASMKRLELAAIGLDPTLLAHRALPPRTSREPRRTLERVADYVAAHVAPREGS